MLLSGFVCNQRALHMCDAGCGGGAVLNKFIGPPPSELPQMNSVNHFYISVMVTCSCKFFHQKDIFKEFFKFIKIYEKKKNKARCYFQIKMTVIYLHS